MNKSIQNGQGSSQQLFSKKCFEIFQSELTKNTTRDMLKPVVSLVYNLIYPYIWMICVYNVLLFVITLLNLFLLFKILYSKQQNNLFF
jgi:hypothetical protein